MGGRPAVAQVAHLICEMFVRLQSVERTQDDCFDFPLTPGGARGGPRHVARPRESRSEGAAGTGFVSWSAGKVCIKNWHRLAALAEFDPLYLNLEMEPR